jgi:hypothetical protein
LCGSDGIAAVGDVLIGESVEDRSAENLVTDQVDHVWGLGLGLGRCELRQRSAWSLR